VMALSKKFLHLLILERYGHVVRRVRSTSTSSQMGSY
jgi:hypothetical protein